MLRNSELVSTRSARQLSGAREEQADLVGVRRNDLVGADVDGLRDAAALRRGQLSMAQEVAEALGLSVYGYIIITEAKRTGRGGQTQLDTEIRRRSGHQSFS